ncbi:MAG: hypothetical protein ACI9H8_001740 [Lysobacterales bacterium]|jgi:hypothetical protein
MKSLPNKQAGASVIATIITIAVIGYGIFIGIQYVPLFIESKSINSILTSIEVDHRTDPITSRNAARDKVIKLLQINEMNDMTESVKVSDIGNKVTITFSYDRVLNLGYEKKKLHYESSRTLK